MGQSDSKKLNAVQPEPLLNGKIAAQDNSVSSTSSTPYSRLIALERILTNPDSSKDFICFLSSESSSEGLLTNQDVESLRKVDNLSIDKCAKIIKAQLFSDQIAAECVNEEFANFIRTADNRFVTAIALSVYPKFVRFEAARRKADANDQMSDELSIHSVNTQCSISSRHSDSTHTTNSIINTAIAKMDVNDLYRLCDKGSWLESLLMSVETLPICISISSANKDKPGFPLIYVNAFFEATTGYARDEILGQNCRFLQAGKAEPESIQRLSVALKAAKPVKVSITNFRKDGMPFRNLLSMKPILDENGQYLYVVGVQFDVTQDNATPARLKLADELMKMLPDVIPSS